MLLLADSRSVLIYDVLGFVVCFQWGRRHSDSHQAFPKILA